MIPFEANDMSSTSSAHDSLAPNSPPAISLDELTIANAMSARNELLAWLECGDATLDLTHVTHIDGAGLQLLLMLRREADRRALAFERIEPSRAVASVLALARLHVDLRPIRQQRHNDALPAAIRRAA
ncbi:STAS domain-containing protein [Lysobacter sp. HA35]